MPKRRTDIDRDAKVEELLEVARRQLVEAGTGDVSVSAVAREVGVAPNTIYWYFGSRDDFYVAVLRRVLSGFAGRKPPHSSSVVRQAEWLVDVLEEFSQVRAVIQQRAPSSAVIAEFQGELDELLRGMVAEGLALYLDPAARDVAVDAALALIEGLLARRLPRRRRNAILRFMLEAVAMPPEDNS